LDGLRPEKFKMDFSIGHSRLFSLQYGKGNFTINSRAVWLILAAVSNPFFLVRFPRRRMAAGFHEAVGEVGKPPGIPNTTGGGGSR
jgi:hypothetical protein